MSLRIVHYSSFFGFLEEKNSDSIREEIKKIEIKLRYSSQA
jgi:hypothetical protein